MKKYRETETGKMAVEVYDLSFLREKEHPYGWLRRHFLHLRLKLALRKADIIYVSETSTGIDLVRYYFVPKDKIKVNADINGNPSSDYNHNHNTMKAITLIIAIATSLVSIQAKPRFITYEKYGAKGDGITDDMPAIVAAHAAANEKGLPVKAKDGKTYYIGNAPLTAEIRTDTDFGKASFIIDDTDAENVRKPVFMVCADKKTFNIKGVQTLMRGQTNLGVKLPCRCLIEVINEGHKVFIRKGRNQNAGTAQKEVLLVSEDGSIDPSTPVVFNYEQITSIKAIPTDEKPIIIKGGTFTTIANRRESDFTYHARGITIKRSGTKVEGITHLITGEGEHGAPYGGFINLNRAADIIVSDCLMTGHKTYTKPKGAAGLPVSQGTYDLNANSCAHIIWKNIRQTNNIDDRKYWGIFTSNFCKDIYMEGCELSRFDAHQSITNVTLKNCTFGHQSVQMVGFGTMLIENCEMHGTRFINLRRDYGSTWDGDIIVRDCSLQAYSNSKELSILNGGNDGSHYFGYPCQLPSSITIERLVIDDSKITDTEKYTGPTVLSSFERKATKEEPFPFGTTCSITLKDISVTSGRPLKLAPNPDSFPGVTIHGLN